MAGRWNVVLANDDLAALFSLSHNRIDRNEIRHCCAKSCVS